MLKIGTKGDWVARLQRGLNLLGQDPPLKDDGDFGPVTEKAVATFQTARGLYADGVVGSSSIRVYNEALKALSGVQADALDAALLPVEADTPPTPTSHMRWVTCPADKVPGKDGYDKTILREDTAVAYKAFLEAVHALGGRVTSAGGKRALSTGGGANQSRKSMHYVGRAFDMALPTGMSNPDKDQFVLTRETESNRRWVVWCRSTLALNELLRLGIDHDTVSGDKVMTGWYVAGGQVRQKNTSGLVFNLTELARSFGFEGISARPGFFNDADVTAAEWWHFQYTVGLLRGRTTFGEELLKVYTQAECEAFLFWDEAKDCRYGVDWF
jgi:peptidoglycan hydrolase-like protein with peptidoglycan-binding domain